MKARPRQAVGYIRVSTTRQADSGHSPETQADMIARHCEASGWVLGATERDVGKTGRTARNRPGLDAAIAQVCREEGVLVVASLTRLSRSVKDACQILARLHDCKADLAVIHGGMDTTTISGRLLFQIMAAIAEFESDQIGERVRDAQAYMLQKNGYRSHGPQPAGFEMVNGVRKPNIREQKWLETVRNIYTSQPEGRGRYTAVARTLNRQSIPTLTGLRTGKPSAWSYRDVSRLLAKPAST